MWCCSKCNFVQILHMLLIFFQKPLQFLFLLILPLSYIIPFSKLYILISKHQVITLTLPLYYFYRPISVNFQFQTSNNTFLSISLLIFSSLNPRWEHGWKLIWRPQQNSNHFALFDLCKLKVAAETVFGFHSWTSE